MRKFLATFIILCMACTFLPNTMAAEEIIPDISWYKDEDSAFTLDSPAELAGLAQLVNGGNDFSNKTVTLGADIDLQNAPWTPIGSTDKPFSGTFDGQEKVVKNLYIEDDGLTQAGLFGYLKSNGSIQNVTVENASVNAKSYVGALIGNAHTGTVANCSVTGEISISGYYMVGGLVGSGYADIVNCLVSGNAGSTVTGAYLEANLEGDNVGGLVGFRGEGNGVSTENCRVENIAVSGTRKVGGLIGSAYNNNAINGCSVSNVTVKSTATAEYAESNASSMGIGGLIGTYTDNNSGTGGVLEDCYVSGVTLESGSEIESYVKKGYVTGALRGEIEPPETVENLCATGTNTGANISDDGETAIFNGAEPVAEVNGFPCDSLTKAVKLAKDGETVKLLKDITGSGKVFIDGGRKITVNLNGFDVGFAEDGYFQIYGGTLNLTGAGTIYEEVPYWSPLMVYGSAEDVADYSVVTVGKDVVSKGWGGMFLNNNNGNNYGIRVEIYGTLISVPDGGNASGMALNVNGQLVATEENIPKILIDGATLKVEETGTDSAIGLFLGGYADTTIHNSVISSPFETGTAIEIRAGKLDITNSTITGGSGEAQSTSNGSGSTTVNAGLAVAQHTTKLPVEITVNSGTFTGGAAFYQSNPQQNDAPSIEKVDIAIQDGDFSGDVYSEDKTGFISGGTYTDNTISENKYLSPGMELVTGEDGKLTVEIADGFFTSGTGSKDDPYIISSTESLIAFRDSVNIGVTYAGKYIKLAEGEYDLSAEEWTAIGNGVRSGSGFSGNSFQGYFDGNNQTIENLTVTSSNPANANPDNTVGLFGVVTGGGSVKDLKLSGVNINIPGNELTGSVAALIQNATIDNCQVAGSVVTADGGGVVGRIILEGTISNCINNANVKTSSGVAGGIVSKAYYTAEGKDMRITNCVNNAEITSESYHAAGIAGFSAADISGCTNTGVITAGNTAGGIAGEQLNYGTLSGNTNSGTINGSVNAGGIAGWVRYQNDTASYAKSAIITVTDNSNTGSVYCSSAGGSTLGFGGIVGTVYNTGYVTGNTNTAESISGGRFAAGVVGNIQAEEDNLFYSSRDVRVKHNVSKTSLENITGDLTDLYAYNNEPAGSSFVVAHNGTDWTAQIGETKYACLEGAVEAAGEMIGDVTICLIGNIDVGYMIADNGTIDSSYSKYFDLSGSDLTSLTITAEDGNSAGITSGIDGNGIDGAVYCPVINVKLPDNAALTVKGLTFADDLLFDSEGGSVIIENCTFNGSQSGYPKAKSIQYLKNTFEFTGNADGFYSHNAYAVWYKVDHAFDFVFDGNIVTGYRGVHIETRQNGQADIKVDNNQFTLKKEAEYNGSDENHNAELEKHLQKEVALQLVGYLNGEVSFQNNTVDAYMGVCLYKGIQPGTSDNVQLTIQNNTLTSGTKLFGSSEWNYAADETPDSDTFADNFIASLGDDANVDKRDPVYEVPTNLTAVYGQTLADVTLPSAANGVWSWSDATASVGNVGPNEFQLVFTPYDTDKYNTVTVAVTVTVSQDDAQNPDTPAPDAVTYGVKLSDIQLPDGWAWADGTIVPTVDNNGYAAYFTVSDSINYDWSDVPGYNPNNQRVERDITLTVNPATPTVTLSVQNASGTGASRSVDLAALLTGVGSGEVPSGEVEYYNGTELLGKATLTEGKATFTWTAVPAGDHSLKAVYKGSVNYTEAEGTTSYNLAKDTQEALEVSGIPETVTYGDETFALTVSGGSGEGALSYSVTSGDSVSVDASSGDVTIIKAGESTITVTKAGDANYNEISTAVTIKVEQAVPTVAEIPEASRIVVYSMLSASTISGGVVNGLDGQALEGTWSWKTDHELTNSGRYEETAVFTPTDTNYCSAEATISVQVYSSGNGSSITPWNKVTFNSQGGSKVNSINVNRNNPISEPEAPVKEGYVFGGWYTDADCTEAYDFDTRVTKNITLYAKWTEEGTTEPTDPENPTDPEDPENPENPADPDVWENPFSDIDENAWYYDAVKYVTENGLFSGTETDRFSPDEAITRGMLVTVLHRSEGEPVVNYLMTFDDVSEDSYYGDAVRWAASEGIITGYSDTEFAPDKVISREEMAAVLERYASYKGEDTSARGDLAQFADQETISDWAVANMEWAVGAGIINGKDNSTLDPKGTTTRAEVAVILNRFLENMQ